MIHLIAAMDRNRGIGKNNQLLWNLPEDMKHFINMTNGKIVLMGRKTHESIGKKLPNRINLIMTRDKEYSSDGCYIINSLEEFLKLYDDELLEPEDDVFIIGGAEIYEIFMPLAERLHITIIDHVFEDADAFFPKIDEDKWEVTSIRIGNEDGNSPYDYSFITLTLKSS